MPRRSRLVLTFLALSRPTNPSRRADAAQNSIAAATKRGDGAIAEAAGFRAEVQTLRSELQAARASAEAAEQRAAAAGARADNAGREIAAAERAARQQAQAAEAKAAEAVAAAQRAARDAVDAAERACRDRNDAAQRLHDCALPRLSAPPAPAPSCWHETYPHSYTNVGYRHCTVSFCV